MDVTENTMPAFEHAVALGYRYVETDVQVTADGVLVAFHDDDLSRTCGRPGLISQLPWREVSTALVGDVSPIPLLDELLHAWPDLRVNIDCKSDAAAPALISTLRRSDALDRVCVGSFSDRRTRRISAAFGERLCTALGPQGIAAVKFGRSLGLGRSGRFAGQCAQVPITRGRLTVTDARFVDRAHSLGLQVHVWIVDEPDEMDRLLDLGVDGLMTDRPAQLRAVLQRRGQWRS
ncbi:MAG: ugpQ [Ilumatobacteraceae bacterium]|nr:ugpQ [Ilumatobacteraceae bacterium]